MCELGAFIPKVEDLFFILQITGENSSTNLWTVIWMFVGADCWTAADNILSSHTSTSLPGITEKPTGS